MQSLTQSSSHDAFRLQRITDTQRVLRVDSVYILAMGNISVSKRQAVGWTMLYLFPHALPYLLTLNKVVCHFRATGVTWWIPFKFNDRRWAFNHFYWPLWWTWCVCRVIWNTQCVSLMWMYESVCKRRKGYKYLFQNIFNIKYSWVETYRPQ